jgi:hypothetical protein
MEVTFQIPDGLVSSVTSTDDLSRRAWPAFSWMASLSLTACSKNAPSKILRVRNGDSF